MKRRRRRLLLASPKYLLRDDFLTALPAGSVNGTAAEPGPGVRTVGDTNSVFSITGGKLTKSGAGLNNNPYFHPGAQTRTPGKIMVNDIIMGHAAEGIFCGWFTGADGSGSQGALFLENGTGVIKSYDGTNTPAIATWTISTQYRIANILRANGIFQFIKSGSGPWLLSRISNIGNTATLYAAIKNYGVNANTWSADFLRIPASLWLPTPIVSDGFGSAFGVTDGLGHAEGVTGGLGAGGSGKTWTGATWSVSGGQAVNTPTVGAELNSGTLTIGSWYKITASEADHFYTGSAVDDTFRAQAATALDANNKVKLITFAEMFASLSGAPADNLVNNNLTITGNAQAGIVMNLDAANPQNFVQAHYNKTTGKVTLLKMVGGVYQADILNVTAAYSAGAELMVRKIGTSYYVWYNNVLIGSATISDAGIVNNTLHGLFSTDPTASIDNFVVRPSGSNGEYSLLDRWAA